MSRRGRAFSVAVVAVPAALSVVALLTGASIAQTALPDPNGELLQPSLSGDPTKPPRFRRAGRDAMPPVGRFTAPSRIGATPVYGNASGSGAGETGFDSTNTKRIKTLTQPVPANTAGVTQAETTFVPVPSFTSTPPRKPPRPAAAPVPPEIHPRTAANRPGAALPPPALPLPVSNPTPEVYPAPAATRPGGTNPIPPLLNFEPSASTPPPNTPPPNTLPLGTVPQRPLPIAAGDPYAALGLRAGTFLFYPAVELSAGYSSNPERIPHGPGSSMFIVAPELLVQSDWSQHSLTANLRGSYTEFGATLAPSLNRPFVDAKVDGRIDASHDTQIIVQSRFLMSTDNPGSPNVQAGIANLPIYTTVGGTLGVVQNFNRLQVTVKGTFDRSSYAESVLTDGEIASNADRNFNQYGGVARIGYELNPGFKPFVEVNGDERIHDQLFDRNGVRRDSTGTSVKVGDAVNLFGTLTGEVAVGYMERTYQDPTLPNIAGLIADGALIWQPSALTTFKFTATSVINESVVVGTSGAFSRDTSLQLDHTFRRWLIGTLQLGYGRDNYVGLGRLDNRYFVSGGLRYVLSRQMSLRGEVRQDWLASSVTGVANQATSFLVGVRLQR